LPYKKAAGQPRTGQVSIAPQDAELFGLTVKRGRDLPLWDRGRFWCGLRDPIFAAFRAEHHRRADDFKAVRGELLVLDAGFWSAGG